MQPHQLGVDADRRRAGGQAQHARPAARGALADQLRDLPRHVAARLLRVGEDRGGDLLRGAGAFVGRHGSGASSPLHIRGSSRARPAPLTTNAPEPHHPRAGPPVQEAPACRTAREYTKHAPEHPAQSARRQADRATPSTPALARESAPSPAPPAAPAGRTRRSVVAAVGAGEERHRHPDHGRRGDRGDERHVRSGTPRPACRRRRSRAPRRTSSTIAAISLQALMRHQNQRSR